MTKQEFSDKLKKLLSSLTEEEISERIGFYLEMIDDRIEEGLSEEEAVAAVGSVEEIAEQIKSDVGSGKQKKSSDKEKTKLKTWEKVVIFAGLPLWLTLLISAIAVIVSLYAAVWSVIVAFWAVFGALAGGAAGGLVGGLIGIIYGNAYGGILLIGSAVVCAGLSIFTFFGCRETTKALVRLTKRIFKGKTSTKSEKIKKSTKIWLIVAASLVVLGLAVFTVALASHDWSFKEASSQRLETNSYVVSEEFENISIDSDTADIVFLPSADGTCRIECIEHEKENHRVSVEDGRLEIIREDKREWYDYISFFSFESTKITIYLPENEYGKLTVKESTGNISLEKASFEEIDLTLSTGHVAFMNVSCRDTLKIKTSTGDVFLTSVTAKSINSVSSTGDMVMKDVIVQDLLEIKRSTGDVRFEACDAGEIKIVTDTGDVDGSLLSEKNFVVKTSTGDIEVPETTSGGRCEITTDTGDVNIIIAKH